jgi:hypothetical protein
MACLPLTDIEEPMPPVLAPCKGFTAMEITDTTRAMSDDLHALMLRLSRRQTDAQRIEWMVELLKLLDIALLKYVLVEYHSYVARLVRVITKCSQDRAKPLSVEDKAALRRKPAMQTRVPSNVVSHAPCGGLSVTDCVHRWHTASESLRDRLWELGIAAVRVFSPAPAGASAGSGASARAASA